MKEIRLRYAAGRDAERIAGLELRSAEHECRRIPLAVGTREFAGIWRERIVSGAHVTLLAEGNGELLGFLSFSPSVGNGRISCLYIEPRYFRRGVGRRLMNAAERLARRHGARFLEVEVEIHNRGGQSFYRALSFKARGLVRSHLIVMTKELSPAGGPGPNPDK